MISFLLSFSLLLAGAQQVEIFDAEVSNLKLNHELIYGHPGYISGDYDAYTLDLLTAIEIDHKSPLLNEAAFMLVAANAKADRMLPSARLARLLELLKGGIAYDRICMLFNSNLYYSRFQLPERLPFREDLFSTWITNWQVTMPLGDLNYSNALDQPFELPLRDNTSQWQTVERSPHAPTANVAVGAPTKLGLGVAVSFFESMSGPALLNFSCDEPVKLWLNGQLIFDHLSFDVFSRPTQTLYQVPVASGWNEIVVCYTLESRPQVGARILDLNGDLRAVNEWTDAESMPAMPARAGFSAARVDLYPELNEDGAFNSIRKLSLLTQMQAIPQALLVAEPLEMTAHQQLAWLRSLYLTTSAASHFDDSILRQRVDDVYTAIEESNYYVDLAYNSEIRRLLKEDQKNDALELCESLLADLPNNRNLQILHVLCRSYFDYSFALTRAELEELTLKYPRNATAWNILIQQAQQEDNQQRYINLLDQRLQFLGTGVNDLITQLLLGSSQQQQRAKSMIDRMHDERPRSAEAQELLIEWWELNNDLDAIAAHQLKQSERYPRSLSIMNSTVSRLHGIGDDSGALAALEHLEQLSPGYSGIINWKREFGLPVASDTFFEEFGADADAALATRSDDVLGSQFTTTLLLDSAMYYLYSDNSLHAITHTLTQINNKKGALDSGTQSVSGRPIHMRVIKADGTIYEAHQVDESWVLPTLEPGDVIDSKFEYFRSGTVGVPTAIGEFTLQAFNTPFDLSRAAYFIADGCEGEFRVVNFDNQQIIENHKGGTVHIFESIMAPALIPENYMPAQNTILPKVSYGSDFDLSISANQLYHWLLNLSQCPADIEAELAMWLDELNPQGDARQRAATIYWAVQDLISDFDGFNDIIDTFTLGQGRPIGLLAKLYELNGITHEWAFIKQQAEHLISGTPLFETGTSYQIPALRLPPIVAGGTPLWVFAIEHYAPLGLVEEAMYGAEAMVVKRNSYRLEKVMAQIPSDLLNNDIEIHFHVRDDNSAEVSGEMHMRVMQGAMMRKQLKQISPDQLSQAQLSFAGNLVKGLDVTSGEFFTPDPSNDDRLFHYSFTGTIQNFVQARGERFGGRLRFPLSSAIHAQLGKADREYDFVLPIREFSNIKVRVTTEGGYTMNYGPVSNSESFSGFNYDINIEKSESEINFEVNTRFDGLKIAKGDFAGFLALLQEIEKQEKRMIEFIPVVVEETVAETE